jgi:hypothetical protein
MTFTRTKKKTQDEEHIVSETPEVQLSAKPTDSSHRTVTDASTRKNPAAEETKEHPE